MNRKSDFAEIFWSVLIPLVVVIGIAILIGSADSLDAVVFGK